MSEQQTAIQSASINLFELAVRKKWRFQRAEGGKVLSVEDLFDIPLDHPVGVSLNALAIELHKKLKDAGEVQSFVAPSTVQKDQTTEQQFELIKLVISIRVKEIEAKKAAAVKAARRKELIQLRTQKEHEALQGRSIDDIDRELAELDQE